MGDHYSADSTMQPIRIFLADDDPDDCLLFEYSLREHLPGCEFHQFDNGQLLLTLVEKAEIRPDVIFLDLNMPLMNGAATYQLLQCHPIGQPF